MKKGSFRAPFFRLHKTHPAIFPLGRKKKNSLLRNGAAALDLTLDDLHAIRALCNAPGPFFFAGVEFPEKLFPLKRIQKPKIGLHRLLTGFKLLD